MKNIKKTSDRLTAEEARIEYEYRVAERLGMLTEGHCQPTPEQIELAQTEARAAMAGLT